MSAGERQRGMQQEQAEPGEAAQNSSLLPPRQRLKVWDRWAILCPCFHFSFREIKVKILTSHAGRLEIFLMKWLLSELILQFG